MMPTQGFASGWLGLRTRSFGRGGSRARGAVVDLDFGRGIFYGGFFCGIGREGMPFLLCDSLFKSGDRCGD